MNFDEIAYLDANPDVAAAVVRGEFTSGEDHYARFGKFESRSVFGVRADRVLAGLDRCGLGLEIGPSHNPIAPKRKGFNVHIVDHLDTEGLRQKYAGHAHLGVHIDNIEEVDFVSHGQPLPKLIGKTGCYDWIIASHVIEHIPNPAEFFRECEQLLKPGGRLSLVVPDMRFCFDYFGAPSSTGAVLDAWHSRRTRPTPGQVFDHFANSTKRNGVIAWSAEMQSVSETSLELLHDFDSSARQWEIAQQQEGYIDSHCWRFIPESFRLLVGDLVRLGVIQMNVVSCSDTMGCEFFCQLMVGAGIQPSGQDRLAALSSVAKQLGREA